MRECSSWPVEISALDDREKWRPRESKALTSCTAWTQNCAQAMCLLCHVLSYVLLKDVKEAQCAAAVSRHLLVL